jgi:CMP/dCMP kinase
MAVITISRQIGSLSCEIAHTVKDYLDYRIVWRDLINQAAIHSGMPDMALAVIDELGLLGISPTSKKHQAYIQSVNQVMQDLAAAGRVVIVGRAGQAVLHGMADTLHVRLYAPVELRAERVAKRHQVSREQALAQVHASDRARGNYLKRFYNVRWDDPDLYHLAINTGEVSPKLAADLICQAALNFSPVPALEAGIEGLSPDQTQCQET